MGFSFPTGGRKTDNAGNEVKRGFQQSLCSSTRQHTGASERRPRVKHTDEWPQTPSIPAGLRAVSGERACQEPSDTGQGKEAET